MAIAWALARVNANAKISGNIFSRIIRLINALYVQLKINLFFVAVADVCSPNSRADFFLAWSNFILALISKRRGDSWDLQS